MNCPKCGKLAADDTRTCAGCGTALPTSAGGASGGARTAEFSQDSPTIMGDAPPELSSDVPTGGDGAGASADGKPGQPTEPGAVIGTLLRDRYEILAQLGCGGFAVVYKARDRKLERVVAIKRLLAKHQAAADASQIIQRFLRESQTIASLNHRNIVAVYDCDADADGHFIVMEYVEGVTLRDYLKQHGRLPLDQAIHLIGGIAQGLSYAHRRKLVHRDIKPANILLAREEDELIPKIVDFGLARADTTSDLSETGMGMGTPYYMPPEQRRNAKNVNQTADIYALGKVLYELVTGDLPDNIHPGKIPPPPRLTEIILKCVESRPEDRYFAADDLRRSLESLQAALDKAASAPPPVIAAVEGPACPGCGVRNPPASRFCVGCGRDLQPAAAPDDAVHRLSEALENAWQRRDLARMEEHLRNLEKLSGVNSGLLEASRQRVAVAKRLGAADAQLTQVESACNHGRWQKAAAILTAVEQALADLPVEDGPAGDWPRGLRERLSRIKEGFDASCTGDLRREVLELTRTHRHPDADRLVNSIPELPVRPEVRDPLFAELTATMHRMRLEQMREFFTGKDWDKLEELGRFLLQAHPHDTNVNDLLDQAKLEREVSELSAKAWKLFQNRQYRDALEVCARLLDMGAAGLPVNAPDAACTCGELVQRVRKTGERAQALAAEITVAHGRNRWGRVEKLGLEYLDLQPGDQAMLELVNQGRIRLRKQRKLLRIAVVLLLVLAGVVAYNVRNLRQERRFCQARDSGNLELALRLAQRLERQYVPAAKFLSEYELAVAGRARAAQMYQAIVAQAGGKESELLPKDAVAKMAAADQAFAAGQYEEAGAAWESAALSLVKARPIILGSEKIARAEAGYAAELQQTDVSLVARWAAEPWKQAQTDAVEARRLGRSLHWDESVATWQKAAQGLAAAREAATAARNQSAYAAMLARGENQLKEGRFAAAVSVFQDAMKLPGFAEDPRLKTLLAKALQEAENSRAREAAAAAEPVKRVAAAAAPVARVQPAVPDVILTVKAKDSDGEKLAGASVLLDGVLQAERTPFAFKLAGDRCHWIVLNAPAGKEFKSFATNWTPTKGEADQELIGVLDRHVYSTWVAAGDLKLTWIPPGEAQLGSTAGEQAWATSLDPAARKGKVANSFGEEGAEPRKARVTGGFWLGQTEVTVGQWRRFAGSTNYRSTAEKAGQAWCYDRVRKDWGYVTAKSWKDPGYAFDVQESNPVVCVTGEDINAFCRWLTDTEGKANRVPAGWVYRLPAEFEWEYACRGGARDATRYWWGDAWEDGKGRLNGASNDKLGFNAMGQAWKGATAWSDGFAWAAPVDSFAAHGRNGFELADMLGNVGEWCADVYDPAGAHETANLAVTPGAKRVVRGGSFYCPAAELRTACRFKYNPVIPYADVGFRVCLGPAPAE